MLPSAYDLNSTFSSSSTYSRAFPRLITPVPIVSVPFVIELSLIALRNANLSMNFTEFGISITGILEQYANEYSPIALRTVVSSNTSELMFGLPVSEFAGLNI